MSGLSYLSGYGSSSEESDVLEKSVKPKLPVPDLSKVSVIKSDEHIDHPNLHSGRIRSFPHVRGNWATFVYVKYPCEEFVNKVIEKLQKVVCINACWQRCEDLHISLSKTVVLNYHLIVPFTNSLQSSLGGLERFELAFGAVEAFCNEENSRTFISLEVDYFCKKFLTSISEKVDEVLVDFKLPTFYEDPSFHMSILWTNGNKKSEIINLLDQLNEILTQEIVEFHKTVLINQDPSFHMSILWTNGNKKSEIINLLDQLNEILTQEIVEFHKTVLINQVICKSGNKYFQFNLL